MKNKKQITLNNLKEAYTGNTFIYGRFALQAYQDLKIKYNETPPEDWERVSIEAVKTFDHLRSLLIRAEYLERRSDINSVIESENIDIKLERHQYAPEMNKAHFYLIVNKARKKVGIIPAPQCTTIGEAVEALTGTQLKNLCLYV
jgi:hypothetical protein